MSLWDFIRLFRMLFGPAKQVDTNWIESRGLLAVKIAQMYAIRSDLLEVDSCRKLEALYEQATPAPWEAIDAIIREHASDSFRESVQDIDQEPLATASLGQVHTASLENGDEVVVKILRTDHLDAFLKDIKQARFLAKSALFFYPKLEKLADPLGTVETIERTTLTEMNLLNEISGTKRLEEMRDASTIDDLKHLHFPKIYEELSSKRVLVVERLKQKSVRQLLDADEFEYKDVLKLFRIHGYFLFLKGEFHGDLHPGNIYFDNGECWFIDNANVEQVPVDFTRGLLRFLGHIGRQDYREAANTLMGLSELPLDDAEAFIASFTDLYAGFGGKPIGEESLTNQMMSTVKLAVHSGMQFPAGAFPVIKSLMYLDGMALRCAPEAVLLDDVLEFASMDAETV